MKKIGEHMAGEGLDRMVEREDGDMRDVELEEKDV